MEWIISNDVAKESWSRLLEFANIDFALNTISRRHGVPGSKKQEANYQKQAEQIRACLLQSREYFTAAKQSSLITSPNHAYYGMVSLASTIMLILGDGTKSLDFVRQSTSNKNHGLRFSSGVTKSSAGTGLSILQDSYVEVLPAGHFRLWYETLPTTYAAYGLERRYGDNSNVSGLAQLGASHCLGFKQINGRKYSTLKLMQFLPDLHGELGRYGVRPGSSRFAHELTVNEKGLRTHMWYIHGAGSPSALEGILAAFKVTARNISALSSNIEDGSDGGIVKYVEKKEDSPIQLSFPSARVSLSFDRICYAEEIKTLEFVDLYKAAFVLSMLSRYFPDLWVSCLESNCLAAKLIERFSELLVNKAPMLALSLMSGEDCFVSSNRQPWAK